MTHKEEKEKNILDLQSQYKSCKRKIKRILNYPKSDNHQILYNRAMKCLHLFIQMSIIKSQAYTVIQQPIISEFTGGGFISESSSEEMIIKDKTMPVNMFAHSNSKSYSDKECVEMLENAKININQIK